MNNIYKKLFESGHINQQQHEYFDALKSNKIISLYYELRLILYLGIMLFIGGIGYIAYQNMSDIGHIASMFLIFAAIIGGFYFISKFAKPYSNQEVIVDHIYFDYILILTSLLIISLFTYIQVYFDLVKYLIYWSSFLSAGILFFMAYRYDNRALLSMGITALSAAFGISVTPVDWVKGDWVASENLYLIGILLGASFVALGQFSDIKKHFRFTYQNFGLILYFMGCITAIIQNDYRLAFAFLTLITAGAVIYQTWMNKQILFFLYSNITAYIAFTYIVFKFFELLGSEYSFLLMVYYLPVSCIAYIVLLVKNKSHFAND